MLRNLQQETCLLSQLLSKLTVTSCRFYINVSVLLLDDALLKCVVTVNQLIFIVA